MVDELNETFNIEIVRELLVEIKPDITSEQVNNIWKECEGNPWNAFVLYHLMELPK